MVIRFNIIFYFIYNLFLLSFKNNFLILVIQLLYFVYFYLINKNIQNKKNIILFCMILSIPGSFLSILGTPTSIFPLSWFIVFSLLLFFYSLKRVKKKYFFAILLFLLICMFSIFKSVTIIGLIKQAMMIILFMLSFIIGNNMSNDKEKHVLFKTSEKLYLISVISYTLQIFAQYISNNYLHIAIGNISYMGTGRISYAALFSDYSFSSLYIVSGMMILLIWVYKRQIKLLYFFTCIVYLGIGTLIVNARTGLYAFVAVSIVFLLINFKINIGFTIVIAIAAIIVFPKILTIILAGRGGQSLFDSSNRLELIIESIPVIFNNLLFGVGLGLDTVVKYTGTVPHNLIVQYLVQLGFIGIIPLVFFFLEMFKKINIKKNSTWVLFVILLGAMFIPDIVSSRFLNIFVILFFLESR